MYRIEGEEDLVSKKNRYKALIFILVGLVCLNINRDFQILNDHTKRYTLNDFLQRLFIDNQTNIVKEDPLLYLGYFTILYIGIIYTSSHLKDINQFHLMRIKYLNNYIKRAFKQSFIDSLIYVLLVSFTTIAMVYLLQPSFFRYPAFINDLIIFALYGFSLFLFLLTINLIMIFTYLRRNNLIILYIGFIFSLIVFSTDILVTNYNFILYNQRLYFIDSILFWGTVLSVLYLFKKQIITKMNHFN